MATHTDFETFSAVDVRTVGSYRYAMDPTTEPLLFSWAGQDGPPDTWRTDIDLLMCPADLVERINGGDIFLAWNAPFERAIWYYVMHLRYGWPDIPPRQWYCVAAQAAALALPRALENAGAALNIPALAQKDPRGSKLINLFCKPRKPTKKNPATRIYPKDMPVEWEEFVQYNRRDVISERHIYKVTPPLSAREANIWRFDMRINERGLPLDVPLIRKTVKIARQFEAENAVAVNALTGGINSTQNDKLRAWLNEAMQDPLGENQEDTLDNLQRKPLEEFMELNKHWLPDQVREVLQLRIEGARVSVKKLLSMLLVACPDHRARGLFLFWGARTGRWAGKLLQPHNFTRGTFTQFLRNWLIELLALEDAEAIKLLAPPLEALSNVMRGFICAPDGRIFYVVDYAQIEARIVVWLAGQEDVLDMYRRKVDLYRWMGSHVYKKPPHEITTEERRVAKHIVLGCGFGMGGPKFVRTCWDQGGLVVTLEFAKHGVGMYRSLHPKVASNKNPKGLWRQMQDAAIDCVRTGQPRTAANDRIGFFIEGVFLRMRLPSGRLLSYPFPKLYPGEYGDELTYMSEHPKTHQWVREKTYGGKLTENAVQAIARDIMVEGMINAEKAGYEVDGTVHDELITERAEGTGNLHEFEKLVCRLPTWADGCPIAAEAFAAKRWRKQ